MDPTQSTRHLLSVLIWFPAAAALFALFIPRQAPKLLRAYGVGVGLFLFGQSLQLLVGSTHSIQSRTFRDFEVYIVTAGMYLAMVLGMAGAMPKDMEWNKAYVSELLDGARLWCVSIATSPATFDHNDESRRHRFCCFQVAPTRV